MTMLNLFGRLGAVGIAGLVLLGSPKAYSLEVAPAPWQRIAPSLDRFQAVDVDLAVQSIDGKQALK